VRLRAVEGRKGEELPQRNGQATCVLLLWPAVASVRYRLGFEEIGKSIVESGVHLTCDVGSMGMSGDAEFASEWELGACVVTRELLGQIESKLEALEADVIGRAGSEKKYEISVFDDFGAETFRAAGDIPMRGFPETTETIRIILETPLSDGASAGSRSIKLKMVFRSKHGNRMSLRIRGPLAREKAIGLCERIDQLVEPHEIDSWVFHRRDWVIGLCGFVAIIGGLVWLANTYDQLTVSKPKMSAAEYWTWTAAVGTACAYWSIVHWFFPCCAFETNVWRRRQEWRRWAVQGFFGLIVFDTVLTTVGRRLLAALGL
jgi:hypothetical protein